MHHVNTRRVIFRQGFFFAFSASEAQGFSVQAVLVCPPFLPKSHFSQTRAPSRRASVA